jgi:hypothetical protein
MTGWRPSRDLVSKTNALRLPLVFATGQPNMEHAEPEGMRFELLFCGRISDTHRAHSVFSFSQFVLLCCNFYISSCVFLSLPLRENLPSNGRCDVERGPSARVARGFF